MDHHWIQPFAHFIQPVKSIIVVLGVKIEFRVLGEFEWNRVFSRRIVGVLIKISNAVRVENRVWSVIRVSRWKRAATTHGVVERSTIRISKNPASMSVVGIVRICVPPSRVHNRDGHDVFESLQRSNNESSVRSRACIRGIKMVSSGFGWKLSPRFVTDEATPNSLWSR
ncbi:unnamed protein product [Pseudo-nitzschia multistriata]|uniref:Uncharacterized protein n=1 Tax=Pseudo-nitzschia multistriata TaxID=183589 RepID=A0A448YVB1_9STRA|nr:unnamed protein product [Pseudo-nitzschia multistriata]